MTSSHTLSQPAAETYKLTEHLLANAHNKYDINYNEYFANHLPHALYTLCTLGASATRVQAFYDMYVKRLEPISQSIMTIDSSNWAANMGNKKLYADYLRYFDNEVNANGLKGTFDLYFPQLMGESLGAALHPLINIGYAMEYNNPIILSEGLAYICIEPLQHTSTILTDNLFRANADTTLFHLIEELQAIQFLDFPTNTDLTFDEKATFLLENHWKIFQDLIAKWDLAHVDQFFAKLNELTEASILGTFGTYSKQIDFFLVHGLTGNHAVRVIFPNLSEAMQRQLLKVNLLGFLTDYVIQGRPKIDVNLITGYKEAESDETKSWDNILKRTIATDEEHVLKVVRCLKHYMDNVPTSQRAALFTDNLLKQCAFKMVDLIQEPEDYKF